MRDKIVLTIALLPACFIVGLFVIYFFSGIVQMHIDLWRDNDPLVYLLMVVDFCMIVAVAYMTISPSDIQSL